MCVCVTILFFKYILLAIRHLQQSWEKFIDSWLNCKYEIHFNNIKLENLKRSQDNSQHDRKEMLKYIKRIYRSQSPEKYIRRSLYPGTSGRRKSDAFVATPPSKVFIRRTASAPSAINTSVPTQLSHLQRLSDKQRSFDCLNLSPPISVESSVDSVHRYFGDSVDKNTKQTSIDKTQNERDNGLKGLLKSGQNIIAQQFLECLSN